jgi:hypothetical protein
LGSSNEEEEEEEEIERFLHFFFSIKVCYREISSRIRATVARRRKRRSKFPNQEIPQEH